MVGSHLSRLSRVALSALLAVGLAGAGHAETMAPNLFGSVALPVGTTPDAARFATVARGDVTPAAAKFAEGLRGSAAANRLAAVNHYVNAHVAYAADAAFGPSADRWSTGRETLSRGKGDCEDYAIAKMAMLRHAGFSADDLYLSLVRDLVRRESHAILAVRVGESFYVLDNASDRLLKDEDVRDYRPVMTFAAGRAFAHGFRRTS